MAGHIALDTTTTMMEMAGSTPNMTPPFRNDTCPGNETASLMFLENNTGTLQMGILISYMVTMIVGTLGNLLVIYIIGKNSQIRNKSVANYYIWNLAFSDLFFVLTMPFFCYATYYKSWPFGTLGCMIATVFHETNRYVSMFTLVALSFDRFLASYYNLSHLRTVRVGIIVCFVIWLLCGTISIPYWMYSDAADESCKYNFGSTFMTFWTFFQLCIGLLIPLVLICLSYILLALRLKKILKASASSQIQKPSRKMIRTVVVVVVIFIVCQSPWHANELVNLGRHYQHKETNCIPPLAELKGSMYLNTISTILVFISSCCNPILYGILNDNYRKLYSTTLCRCCYREVATDGKAGNGIVRDGHSTHIPVVYRFQISFHPPCFGARQRSNKHQKMSVVSQDCTMFKTAETEDIEMNGEENPKEEL